MTGEQWTNDCIKAKFPPFGKLLHKDRHGYGEQNGKKESMINDSHKKDARNYLIVYLFYIFFE